MPDDVAGAPAETDRAARSRSRILGAARAEFAAAGFGGGRVERIATRAGINKERIYAYFGDKRSLFAAAVASAVEELGAVRITGSDGPAGWAERLFDFMADHPDTVRLLRWSHLESDAPSEEADARLVDLPRPEDAVVRWQRDGLVPPDLDAHDLVVLVLGMCEVFHAPPYRPEGRNAFAVERRRRALVRRTVALLADAGAEPGGAARRDQPSPL
ncbi:TetR family transcriptional regulator [Amnibacterium sp. CER49]|uniref:TetR family transcriptional regulator n=1 Tax=Amnibacterium sp. CER49 TaxID=3039161 RepID=UPI002447B6F5|nr:TetR family transcriptional regulator [Amnibacterium sp. CER49]MDH2444848.1 TetR family transcriptional regulator [Amnibacterium sp. CER49]